MKIHEIMTGDPIVLRPDQTLTEVLKIFVDNKIDGAPVVDHHHRLIGLFTKSHIYRATLNSADEAVTVGTLMTRDVYAGHPEDDFENVVTPMVPRLPVVDANNRIVGMVTRGDIANAFFNSYQNISRELDVIIDSTHNAIISIDEYGNLKVFNQSAEAALGLNARDVIGRHITEIIPNSGLLNVMKKGQVELLQKITINGRDFISNRSPIIKDGRSIGAVAVMHDISEIEKISRELQVVRELNEELDAIIESSFDGLYITDGNGITLRLNKAFQMISGVKPNEFIHRSVEDIEAEGVVNQSVTKLVLERRESVTINQQYKTGRTALATGNPVFDKEGNLFRVVCNVRDITELNMLKQRLEQVQGLSELYASELSSLRIKYASPLRLVANSAPMRKMLEMVLRVAHVESTILITGESGTGKELIAEIIHENSPCRQGPYLKLNCGAIPEHLLESELFGYEGGAFTGARREGKPGYFELAAGGTLFLDEIAELPLGLQVKLLRVLQSKEITRVGGTNAFSVDVRIIAATNRDLMELVKSKMFRGDLYYRLNVLPIYVPPLRERKDDIPSLVAYFMKACNEKYQLAKRVSPEVIEIFMEHNWPGNVRELENLIERLVVITAGDTITLADMPAHLFPESAIERDTEAPPVSVSAIVPFKEAVESVERQILELAYGKFGSARQIARELQVDVSTIVRKAAKYGIATHQNGRP
jgi:PAS domain S-box-containing protein